MVWSVTARRRAVAEVEARPLRQAGDQQATAAGCARLHDAGDCSNAPKCITLDRKGHVQVAPGLSTIHASGAAMREKVRCGFRSA